MIRRPGRVALALPWLALAVVPVLADPVMTLHRAPVAGAEQDVRGAELDATAERTAWACAAGWSGCQGRR